MRERGQGERFGIFALVGAVGAVLQIALFVLLMRALSLPPPAAMLIAVELAVLHNFVWHDRITWSDRRVTSLRDRAVRLWRFHVANGLMSVVGNTLLAYWLVQVLKFPGLWAAVLAIAVCAPVNFLLADRWSMAVGGRGRQTNPLIF
jgi:putative flippase GtrA